MRITDLAVSISEVCWMFSQFWSTGRLAAQAVSNAREKIQNLSQGLSDLQAALTVGLTVQTAFVSAQTWEGVEKLSRLRKIASGNLKLTTTIQLHSQIRYSQDPGRYSQDS